MTAGAVMVALALDVSSFAFWREALASSVVFGVVGGFITWRRSSERIGWLLAVIGALAAAQLLSGTWSATHLTTEPWSALAGLVSTAAQTLVLVALIQLLLRFPTGSVDGRWRIVAAMVIVGAVVQVAGLALRQPTLEDFGNIDNPIGPVDVASVAETLGGVIWLVGTALALVSVVVRFRRATTDERAQYAWFLYAAFLTVVALLLSDALGIGDLGWVMGPSAIACGVAAAVVLHGLYDIRVVFSRSIAFALASALLLVVHVAVATLLADGVGTSATGAGALATAAVAVSFAPVFGTVGRAVERLLFGARAAPDRFLAALHRQIRSATAPGDLLGAMADTIADGLRLPSVRIDVGGGEPAGGQVETFELRYHGQAIGQLEVEPRRGDECLGDRDRALLEEVATQIAPAVHALTLAQSLQASHARLVTAREEERRRIRRDLHDGLGPMLTGLGLKLDVLHSRVRPLDEDAADTIGSLRRDTGAAIDSVRRLVYDLRPPALDDLGLVAAIEEQAAQLQSRLAIRVNAPSDLGPLPAASEVAALHIVSEAMNNAVRHSGGASCVVTIEVRDALHLEIVDDGVGIAPDARRGVGLSSMCERAADAGGRCDVDAPTTGGTRVRAQLPAGSTA